MDTSPTSRQFSSRLEQLNREIRTGLEQVRRHIQELKSVEQVARDGAGQNLAKLLRHFAKERDPPIPRL